MRGRPGDAADFWSKVDVGDWQECWPWRGSKTRTGYGMYYPTASGSVCAHRQAFELLVGPIPKGLELDHVREWGCRSRSCCNPLHLEPVTHQENNRRAKAAITHCPHGHPYDDANTYRKPNGHRECRACHRDQERRRKTNPAANPPRLGHGRGGKLT